MPDKHAILSPSGAARWLACTPSARLEQQYEDKGSDYAAEGTLAHKVAELKLRKLFTKPMTDKELSKELNKVKRNNPLYENGEKRNPKDYWPEILSCTDEYKDYAYKTVLSFKSTPYIAVEQHLDLSNYAPECFGTGDCIIIGADTLHIIDYKHGKGVVVEAENNPQIMLYALGAIERYHMLYSIKKVVMTIVQPRATGDTIKEFEMSAEDLINWGVFTVRPKATQAFAGEGDFIPGEHCRFCRAKAQCRARADGHTALEVFGGKKPPLLSDTEVGDILTRAKTLAAWVKDLEDYAQSAILAGKQIPGWKVVEGRSTRKFDDSDAAFKDIIAAGYDEAILYKREPLTLAQAEKVIGKAKFAEIAGSHIVTPPGKPALAPESDKKPPYQPKTTAAEAFGGANKTEE